MIRPLVFLATLAASWVDPTGAVARAAAPAVLVSSVTVRYDAVDLRSNEGIASVYGRLQLAARRSCDSLPVPDRWTATARHRCRGDTLEAAIRQVHHARLTAHHRVCQRDATDPRCPHPPEA